MQTKHFLTHFILIKYTEKYDIKKNKHFFVVNYSISNTKYTKKTILRNIKKPTKRTFIGRFVALMFVYRIFKNKTSTKYKFHSRKILLHPHFSLKQTKTHIHES